MRGASTDWVRSRFLRFSSWKKRWMRLLCAVGRVPGIAENDAPGAGRCGRSAVFKDKTCGVDVNQPVPRACTADDRLNTLVQPSRGRTCGAPSCTECAKSAQCTQRQGRGWWRQRSTLGGRGAFAVFVRDWRAGGNTCTPGGQGSPGASVYQHSLGPGPHGSTGGCL